MSFGQSVESKLVLNVKYFLLLFFLTAAEFYNLGHIQGIKSVRYLKRNHFLWFLLLSDMIFMSVEKIKTNIQH